MASTNGPSCVDTDTPRSASTLFSPIQIGAMRLSHRIVMAPMTRLRSTESHIPLEIAKTYYSQRASTPGTLLITEATFVSSESRGRDANAPGIFSTEQIHRWRTIVDAVHAQGSFIFCQLWHVGRAARAAELERLKLECLSSSAICMPVNNSSTSKQAPPKDEYITPRPMTEEEVQRTITGFATAASNAVHDAGFDGVEIHAANGYLIDQFTQPSCNQRSDRWGGTIENRARFCLEVTRAVSDAIGSEKTGVRLSPFSPFQGMGMDDPIPQFSYLIEQLSEMELAYLHLIEPRVSGNIDRDSQRNENLDFAFKAWKNAGPVILAGGFTPESARSVVTKDYAGAEIAVAFGRHFISNPDLPARIWHGLELAAYDRSTFYRAKSEEGYIDYGFAHEKAIVLSSS